MRVERTKEMGAVFKTNLTFEHPDHGTINCGHLTIFAFQES